jgi:hypothetical protein
MPVTADPGSNLVSAFARTLGWVALAVGAGLALVFAFVAALVVGLMIAGAALALRLTPRPSVAGGADILEAHRTPDGWVVEAGARRKS